MAKETLRDNPAKYVARGMMRTLRARCNPARAEGVQRYFKNTVRALGIDTPTLRHFARVNLPFLELNWSVEEITTFCDLMLREPELEIRGVGILILGGFHKRLTTDWLEVAERWLEERLDNWALVDSFCSEVLSRMLAREPAVEKSLRRWSGHKVLWVRRASLVTLVPFARKGQFLDTAYELARAHFQDPEDLMHKATGWLLREAGKTDPKRLKAFLLAQGPLIPRTALRYAIERFPAGERARLLQATKRR